MKHYIDKPADLGIFRKITAVCFPNYTGKKFSVSTDVPSRIDSYWDGGSRTYYVFYDMTDGKTFNVGSNHPFFEPNKPRELSGLPQGTVLVAHSIFCGKDMGITIYVNPADLANYIPAPSGDLPNDIITVLAFTRGLKPSYAGISDYRFHKANRRKQISRETWDAAKNAAISQGLLNKAGAITATGRNAIANIPSSFTW